MNGSKFFFWIDSDFFVLYRHAMIDEAVAFYIYTTLVIPHKSAICYDADQ